MIRPRPLAALALALVLALTSLTMAVARWQMRGMGPGAGMTVALCTGIGPVEVTLDAQGKPVDPHLRPCPDCVMVVAALAVPVAAVPLAPDRALRMPVRPETTDAASRRVPARLARGPPAAA